MGENHLIFVLVGRLEKISNLALQLEEELEIVVLNLKISQKRRSKLPLPLFEHIAKARTRLKQASALTNKGKKLLECEENHLPQD